MTASRSRDLAVLACGALVSCALAGCTTDDTAAPDIGPTATPEVTILSPTDGACIVVADIPDPVVVVRASVADKYGQATLELMPPGSCIHDQCGHLVLAANGVFNSTSATTTMELLLRKLANRYTDIELSVAAVHDDGTPFVVGGMETDAGHTGGEPVVARVKIKTAASCSK